MHTNPFFLVVWNDTITLLCQAVVSLPVLEMKLSGRHYDVKRNNIHKNTLISLFNKFFILYSFTNSWHYSLFIIRMWKWSYHHIIGLYFWIKLVSLLYYFSEYNILVSSVYFSEYNCRIIIALCKYTMVKVLIKTEASLRTLHLLPDWSLESTLL